jgi:type VI secretion system protein ImpJ
MSMQKIGHVRWFLGQTVLPEHLQALDARADAAALLRARLSGLPPHGVAELSLSEPLLREGILAITAVTAVLPDGEIVSVPGNASLSSLSLTATGATLLPVFLHLSDEVTSASGNPIYADDPRVVERVLYRAHLSISDKLDRSRGVVKLGDFEKNVDGTWRLLPTYIPPLLQVGATPYLIKPLSSLETQIIHLEPQLAAQLQDTFLRPERLLSIRLCLAELYRVLSLIGDLRHKVLLHPYALFTALRSLYETLCCFHEVLPDQQALPYRHDDLGPCMGQLLRLLDQHLKPVYTRSTHLRFLKANGLFSLSQLPEEAKLAQEVYLLVQRATVHERIDMDEVKLSCTSRLALIHRLVLRGVPFKYVEKPPFQHTFGPEVDFYQLQFGEEWNNVLREGALALYIHPVLEKANVFLFWR